MEKPYIAGTGPLGAKIMILGEAPTDDDIRSGRPFTKSRELDYLLLDAGIRKNECWLSYVFKSPLTPNYGKKKQPAHVRASIDGINVELEMTKLQNEINSLQPNIIIGLGRTALWALTGKWKGSNKKTALDQFRGSIIMGRGRKTICTYNPEQLNWNFGEIEFKGYWNKQIILLDLKRAKRQSEFPDFRLPKRTLQICRSSKELNDFRRMYAHLTRMSVDIEALGTCIPGCIGLSLNKTHGITVPLWNQPGISNIPLPDLANVWRILAEMLWEKEIVGQNFNYDRDKIKRLGFIIQHLKSDTMLKTFAVNPELPVNLAFNTSVYTEEPFYKDDGMYHGTPEDLFYGCARDSCVTLEIDEITENELEEIGQKKFYYNFLMKLPEFYLGIENQGFRVDHEVRHELLKKYVHWSENLQYELFQLTGESINIRSPKQVAILLFDLLKCPRRTGTGEEELTSLLNLQSFTDPIKRRVCEIVLEKRRVDKTISTYLVPLTDYDGRMRTTYFPCLNTGRSATGQQEEPIRPEIEVTDESGKKSKKAMGIAFQTMTKHGDIGADVRSMYIPDLTIKDLGEDKWGKLGDTEVFVQADSAQAEARVVFLLANDEQALEDIDKHDYHALTASWFFGGTESDYSKAVLGYESPIRFAGKTLRHAGHLGAGKRRAATELNTQARKYKINISITEQKAEQALRIFHAKQPKIQRVFHAGVVEALKKGRRLVAGLPYGIDAESGGARVFFDRWGDELNRQALSYIPQRSVSDNTKAAGLRIRQRIPNIKIVMEAHDALLFCIPRKKLEEWVPIIKEEMERPISFHKCSLPRRYLKIPCDVEVGNNYEALKKFKFQFQKELIDLDTKVNEVNPWIYTKLDEDTYLDEKIYYHQQLKKHGL